MYFVDQSSPLFQVLGDILFAFNYKHTQDPKEALHSHNSTKLLLIPRSSSTERSAWSTTSEPWYVTPLLKARPIIINSRRCVRVTLSAAKLSQSLPGLRWWTKCSGGWTRATRRPPSPSLSVTAPRRVPVRRATRKQAAVCRWGRVIARDSAEAIVVARNAAGRFGLVCLFGVRVSGFCMQIWRESGGVALKCAVQAGGGGNFWKSSLLSRPRFTHC